MVEPPGDFRTYRRSLTLQHVSYLTKGDSSSSGQSNIYINEKLTFLPIASVPFCTFVMATFSEAQAHKPVTLRIGLVPWAAAPME